ncbi:putative porin [Psychroserpens sp.]|uniref:putative porin n=1 Tax=Psychroserpens sp. TaxID=2020870 RepID=UPI001B0A4D31|nr:putative porin [Psychroserpens sp.]MBO6608023.1 putative porin [Psychroserpens sp.]MBO6654850.1 putative porin [Psychroserpens sp.]MBO6683076.1 putative porin [Psychroserpens sp.]MBO6751381.1 putative porin [Psychroserpens sp.]MBO6916564.1 putative porin [Psychroserpens sp.]
MPKYLIFLLICCAVSLKAAAQKTIALDKNQSKQFNNQNDSLSKRNQVKGFKDTATIDMYKIYDTEGNERIVDTSLTIQKEYKFNYLRQDNFGLMQFANIGQTYSQLTRNFNQTNLLPEFGARARHFNYFEKEDIYYYEVPTPLTELMFKTAFKQGQLLESFFTVNTSRQFNMSVAYKGLRSLGNYQNALTSTGNLRFTSNYKTKNNRYKAFAHIVFQDLLNQENGGLQDEDIENFTSGSEDFLDRAVFDPNFENAESILVGKRFFLNHQYDLIQPKDSTGHSLTVKQVINFEDKYFQFDQTTSDEFFGESFSSSNIRDRVTLENFETDLSVHYNNNTLGDLSFGIGYNDINYGYDRVTVLNNVQIPNRIQDQVVRLSAGYSNTIGRFSIAGKAGVNIIGDFDSSYINGIINFKINDDIDFEGHIIANINAPNYNYLLYQSDYINYNWNNINAFNNQTTGRIGAAINSNKYLNASVDYTTIDNYTYFNLDETLNAIRPVQLDESLSLLRIQVEKEIKLGKFALDNTILYQTVGNGTEALNLADIVTRNTFYYSNHFFKNNALFLQTGITFNYFTSYNMDGYDPLLAEFYTQNQTEIGGFPRLDFFVNAKVRQTRIYLKAEHFNAAFTGYDYFSAPNNPYRDFNIRFGLVWNFFL